MVRRVLTIMYREVRGLHQAAYILGLFAFGSQLLALVRDRTLAAEFGAGATLDIYYAAFRVPDLLYVLFASTLSIYVLVPFVAKARAAGGAPAATRLLGEVFTLFLLCYVVITALVIAFAPQLATVLFPGIADSETLAMVMRILLLQPLFLGISSLCGVITQLEHRFVVYAISPLLYNLGIIFGIVALYPFFGLAGLGYGVVTGAVAHLAVQLPLVAKSSLGFRVVRHFDWLRIRSVLATSLPRAATLSLNQVVLLALFGLASVMAAGSVSVFQFAYNLQSVPLAIIGVSYSVAAFPRLAELFAAGEQTKFTNYIITALRHIIFWSVPAVALIIVLRAQLVRVVLGSGDFDWDDTRLTAATLAVLALALVSLASNLLLIRALYAGGRTAIPLIVSLIGAGLALLLATFFYVFHIAHPGWQATVAALMRLENVSGTEVLAIALGYALAMVIQSIILLVVVSRLYSLPLAPIARHSLVAFTAAAAAGVSAYATLNFVVDGINPETFIGIFIQGFLAGVVGLTGAVLTYVALGSQELKEVYQACQRKLWRADIVAPQDTIL